jgi:hypothetical protein
VGMRATLPRIGPSVVTVSSVHVAESSPTAHQLMPHLRGGRRRWTALRRPATALSDARTAPPAMATVVRLPFLHIRRGSPVATASGPLVFRACGRKRRTPWLATRTTQRKARTAEAEAACGRTNRLSGTSPSYIVTFISLDIAEYLDDMLMRKEIPHMDPFEEL